MEKILILNDDETAGGLLGMVLQREHFLPILAGSLEAALHQISTLQPDLFIIDVPLAGHSAVELCMEVAAQQVNIPIIVLGESRDEMDKVFALEAGADHYIVKPFSPRELVARVRALLRRRRDNLDSVTRFGNVEVDRRRRTVTCQGQEVKMTPCEYNLLLFFLRHTDLVLTRQTLLSSVWGYSDDANTRTVDVHISKLRDKCEPDPDTPRHFVTVHGVGYRFLR